MVRCNDIMAALAGTYSLLNTSRYVELLTPVTAVGTHR